MKDDRNSDALFLVPRSANPCGIEMFSRRLSESGRRAGVRMIDVELSRPHHIVEAWRRIGASSCVVVNLPLVAWKRFILTPLLVMALARLRGRRVVAVLHEWSDLDWRRRIVLSPYVLLSQRLLFSSPMIRRQFRQNRLGRWHGGRDSIIPIPANIHAPAKVLQTPLQQQLAEWREKGTWIIGHFGSIYPKKNSDGVLDIVAELRSRGHDVKAIFVGSFIKGHDNVEEAFRAKLERLNLVDCVTVTGYVETAEEVFSIFSQVDVFAYSFEEGLTSRRASVLTCLQSGRPVVVNAPLDPSEFDHHEGFGRAMSLGGLQFVARADDPQSYAECIERLMLNPPVTSMPDFETSWQAATRVLMAAIKDDADAPTERPGAKLENVPARD